MIFVKMLHAEKGKEGVKEIEKIFWLAVNLCHYEENIYCALIYFLSKQFHFERELVSQFINTSISDNKKNGLPHKSAMHLGKEFLLTSFRIIIQYNSTFNLEKSTHQIYEISCLCFLVFSSLNLHFHLLLLFSLDELKISPFHLLFSFLLE